ncbi:MAG: hypothetical protein GX110_01975 [Synergistaceae bacterium]|jgi:hypothetical protein|nr:hypothetical protein [Synergistaceae bacterium]
MHTRRTISRNVFLAAAFVLLCITGLSAPAAGEVSLFIDAHTVRVHDPAIGGQSVLNDFRTQGHRTHNHLALVWSNEAAWVYDIRTSQWLSQGNFRTLLGTLSDEFALVWNQNEAAVFDAKKQEWIRSDSMPWTITGAVLSRGMAALTGDDGFVVYDPVLKQWQYANDFPVKKAQAGDVLAAAWDESSLVLYDLTLHQWILKEGVSAQACIIDGHKASVFTADKILVYDAMSHRWSEKNR